MAMNDEVLHKVQKQQKHLGHSMTVQTRMRGAHLAA